MAALHEEANAHAASQKYEIYLQPVRQEVTMARSATAAQVSRSTIMRIRTVATEGALAALAASRPGSPGAKTPTS